VVVIRVPGVKQVTALAVSGPASGGFVFIGMDIAIKTLIH